MTNLWDNLNRKRTIIVLIFTVLALFVYGRRGSFFRRLEPVADLKAALDKKNENRDSILPVYNLIISPSAMHKLEQSTQPFTDDRAYYYSQPLKNQNYVDARFSLNQLDRRDVKVKYRGDNYFHWGKKKKSWRIKFKSDELFYGRRKINLNNPKFPSQMENFLSYTYANQLNILGPYSYFTHTRLNRQYLGVMLFVEQVDKFFLINHRLPEGKIYYLENARAWQNASAWEKPGSMFLVQKETKDIELEHFLKTLAIEDSQAFYDQIQSIVHMPTVIKWHAFSSYFGLTHQDSDHNHKFIFDPSRGQFLPLIWDPVLGIKPKKMNVISNRERTLDVSNPLLSKLMSIPKYNLQKNKLLWSFYKNRLPHEKQVKIFNDTYESIKPDILSDNLKEYTYCEESGNWRLSNDFWKESLKGISDFLKKRKLVVEKELNTLNLSKGLYKSNPSNKEIKLKFDHKSISGLRMKNLILNFQNLKALDVKKIQLFATGYKKTPVFSCSHQKSCRAYFKTEGLVIPIHLSSYAKLEQTGFGTERSQHLAMQWKESNDPIMLKLKIDSKHNLPDLNSVVLDVENLVTDKKYKYKLSKISKTMEDTQINSLLFEEGKSEQEIVVWDQDIKIDETVKFSENQKLIIKPGVTVSFAKNASLYIKGNLQVDGFKEEPVIFKAHQDNHWGSVAVLGDDKTTVSIQHAQFIGGSELKKDFIRFSGMLSIYHAHANLRHVAFLNNAGEDALNIKYGNVNASNLTFNTIFSDAFDCDFCNLSLDNSQFKNVINDAIDMSYTDARFNGIRIDKAGDKGISLGERSRLVLKDHTIVNSKLDIAIKDESFLNIEQCSDASNIVMYNKKNEFMNAGCMLSSSRDCLTYAKSIDENPIKPAKKVFNSKKNNVDINQLKSMCSRANDYNELKRNVSWVDLN